jgi:hypothetical protein
VPRLIAYEPRRQISCPVWIKLDDQLLTAILAEIWHVGARIVVSDPDQIPNEFALLFCESGAVRRCCKVQSREGKIVVASFTPDPSKTATENTIASAKEKHSDVIQLD